MDISQEVSDVAKTTSSTIDSPTIQQRKINSTITVQNGETIALGGLIRDNRSKDNNGVPWLKDIPILGYAFKYNSYSTTRTELLVLITPHVVRSVEDLRRTSEQLRDKLPAVQ